jgi:hypothetical protein
LTFDEAKTFIVLFGKHKGETIDDVAKNDVGLLYLDWLVGMHYCKGMFREALRTYLSDHSIASEIRKIQQERER